jgi:hypothetical protein
MDTAHSSVLSNVLLFLLERNFRSNASFFVKYISKGVEI